MESEKDPMGSGSKEPEPRESDEQQSTLEFTDKRRVRLDADDPAPIPPVAGSERPPETADARSAGAEDRPAPADEETAEQMPAMDVYGLLRTTVGLLANGAWAWMGLTPNPFTGEMDRDLAQAKVAIDTVAVLIGQLDPKLSEEERRELQNLVSMLRINFVQQSQQNR